MTTNDDNLRKQMAYDVAKKSTVIALLLWWLLGFVGVHDYYLGDTRRMVIKLILFITIIGWLVLFVWYFVDLFLIFGRVDRHNRALFQKIHGISVDETIS